MARSEKRKRKKNVEAEEIAVRHDFSAFTSAKNPVVNPVLFRSIAKFQQERLWKFIDRQASLAD